MRIAVLVPPPGFHEEWDWAFDVEAAAIRAQGAEVEALPWTDVGDLSGFDLVTPLVAWGYHLDPPRWHALLDRLDRDQVPTLNPVALLRWNSDKRYLAELGDKGIATIATRLVDTMDDAALSAARADFGDELVIKPPVSASADGTHRLGPTDSLPGDVVGKAMMVQPFLHSVTGEGEYSLMLFGGQFSHCIVKRPKAGDYRVQSHLGGREEPCDPPAGAIELAQAALAAAPAEAAYARVDLIRGNDLALKVIELELIEPALWLEHAPDGGALFAATLLQRARQ
ncbi:ATP-grasp domain-containing protein [Sphingomonas jaspsi]|uniref:ATP-grasp domain-containing protein n=1 Tax=Sphingomonas jaspsi TaxID=392409 RepID=UPI0004AD60B1|nr:hypothetical protein [Sphingomonas jaspsi]